MSLLTWDAKRPETVEYGQPGYDAYAKALAAHNALWRATHVKSNPECVEVRKQVTGASLKLVIYKDGDGVSLSANGTMLLTKDDLDGLARAVDEANAFLGKT